MFRHTVGAKGSPLPQSINQQMGPRGTLISAFGLFYPSRTPGSAPEAKAVRLDTMRTKDEHSRMPFENERDDILFTIRMGLMHCRTSPKSERDERVQRIQAEAVLTQLERCGYRIVKTDEDRGVRPSNIGE